MINSGLRRLALGFAATASALLFATLPAEAHHSFNMFALDKLVTIEGTVKDYQYKMPHVWLYVLAPKANGAAEEWGFECHSPNLVARKGWKINTLKAGDKISVVMHPMKDGSKAGSVVRVVLADGRTLWNAQSETQP
jgi:hypothetical protein